MLIKIGEVRLNGNNIASYRTEAKSSIIVNTTDGGVHLFAFKSEAARNDAQDGFSEIKSN